MREPLTSVGPTWSREDNQVLVPRPLVQAPIHPRSCSRHPLLPWHRCKVPTINQLTAEEGLEPSQTLGVVRSGKYLGWSAVNKSWTHSVFFGWNVVSRATGRVNVGDAVVVQGPRQDVLAGLAPAV